MKKLISVSTMFSIAMLAGVLFLGWQSIQVITQARLNEVADVHEFIRKEIDTKAEQAIFMATSIAGSHRVSQAVKQRDRQALSDHFISVWRTMNEKFGVKQFQFHTPEADSLLRLHMIDNYGDSLASFRHTVVEANESLKPKRGIETGVAGIGIRGVVPIFAEKEHVGSVEIGFALDREFIIRLENKFNAAISVYLFNSDMQKEVYYSGNSASLESESKVVVEPLIDYNGAAIGEIKVTCCEEPYRSSQNVVLMSTSIVILLVLIMWFISYRIERRLAQKRQLLKQKNIELQNQIEKEKAMIDYVTKQSRIASLGKLVSGVAHEINTPLGVIVTSTTSLSDKSSQFLACIKQGKVTKSKLENYLDYSKDALTIIESSAYKLTKLINYFKQLSISTNSTEVTEFNLFQSVFYVVNSYEAEIKEAGIAYSIEIPRNLVFRGVYLDVILIFQVLLSNIIKHANRDGSLTYVKISGDVKGEHLIIVTEDDGIGIPEKQLNDIFEPFFSSSIRADSVGLGLSILFNILTLRLSGIVNAKSPGASGKGTSIEIVIPVLISSEGESTLLTPNLHTKRSFKTGLPDG